MWVKIRVLGTFLDISGDFKDMAIFFDRVQLFKKIGGANFFSNHLFSQSRFRLGTLFSKNARKAQDF